MRASLIFPGIAVCGWNTFGRSDAGADGHFVQYGLAYIAAYARRQGHAIDLIDLRSLPEWDAFEGRIRARSPGVFGISATSVDYPIAAEAARRIKRIASGSRVVLGGVHATVALHEVLRTPEFDHVVVGEGEIAFSELLDRIESGLPSPRVIQGRAADLSLLPRPDRELFRYRDGELFHPWLPHMEPPFVSVVTSRGCPHGCKFCQPAERLVFGNVARLRPIDDVVQELNELRDEYGFRSLLIHDDLFTFNRQRVREFCRLYTSEGFTAKFTCQARADFIAANEELVRQLADAGLDCCMIGFESGSQRILDFIGKGTTVEQNYRAAEVCRRHGIRIFANYMFGVPTETADDVRRTVEFIRAVQPDYRSPTLFTPYCGTELHAYCEKHRLLLERSESFFDRAPRAGNKIKGIDYRFVRYAIDRTKQAPGMGGRGSLPAAGWVAELTQNAKRACGRFRQLRRSEGLGRSAQRVAAFTLRALRSRWYGMRYGF